jgi:RNA polymerase sigma factor (sigma-70 family)
MQSKTNRPLHSSIRPGTFSEFRCPCRRKKVRRRKNVYEIAVRAALIEERGTSMGPEIRMPNGQINGVLRQLRRASLRHDGAGLTDGQLIERFLSAREEAAFEALVRRHGPMVFGVCRRVLACAHDAEDAFQATFLVLVRKAAAFAARDTVGNWLYGVAYRTAQKARSAAARRRAKEKHMARPEALREQGDLWQEMRPLIDAELSRLPDKYRAPLVLCGLEGQTRKEAARRLGCPEGTISGRLARARVLLAKRLARHGLALSGGAMAMALTKNAAWACVPASLMGTTVHAAALVAAGRGAAGVVSASVAALTEGVLKTMLMNKVKLALSAALAIGLIGTGIGAYRMYAADDPAGKKEVNKPAIAPGGPAVGAPAKEDSKDGKDDKDDEKINLPKGPGPVQVLASMDKDGKLVIKTAVTFYRIPAGPPGGAVPPAPILPAPPAGGGPGPAVVPVPPPAGGAGGGAAGAPVVARVEPVTKLQSQTYDLDDVQVLDTKDKKIDNKELAKLLKEETVAMASLYGQSVDPLHLRVLKEGTLTFVLPMPKFKPGVPGGVVPLPAPAPPGAAPGGGFGFGGGAGGGIGVAPPGTTVPATPAPSPPKKDPSKP